MRKSAFSSIGCRRGDLGGAQHTESCSSRGEGGADLKLYCSKTLPGGGFRKEWAGNGLWSGRGPTGVSLEQTRQEGDRLWQDAPRVQGRKEERNQKRTGISGKPKAQNSIDGPPAEDYPRPRRKVITNR